MTSPFYVHVTPFLQPHAPLNVSHTNVLSLSFSLSLGLVLVWLPASFRQTQENERGREKVSGDHKV